MSSITISEDDHGFYTVRSRDRYEDRLCKDEVLWCVARVLIRGVETLRTQAEHEEWNAKYAVRPELEPWQKQLPGAQQ